MKAVAVFAVRVVVLTVVLIIAFMIASNVAGMAQAPVSSAQAATPTAQASLPSAQAVSTPTSQAQQAAALLGPLLVYTFLVSAVIAWIIQRSRWRGLKLIAALVFTFYGLMTCISQIETIAYLRGKMPPGLIEKLFVMGAIVALLFVPLAVLIMGKIRGPEQPHVERGLTLKSQVARFVILALVYVVLYYLFGYYVAWQNPDLRLYYAGTMELKSFYQQILSVVTGTPWMLPFQFGRGLLWVLFAYPVIRMLNTRRIETAGIVAALFGVGSFVLLLPNPLMPASIAHSHFWETLGCDLLLGAIVSWVLTADARLIA
ncbi:hypothetical protein [Granulicella arctica]|uniref:Uncharacterized protein n=1 Tax=Granulicella arctica TaxID=940613 RepID=A0A7Y9PE59_9BACT|nr:hypothetical protein [Granulicella arctica]NYF78256.1 hypothetical protein [Granulicella arctica]